MRCAGEPLHRNLTDSVDFLWPQLRNRWRSVRIRHSVDPGGVEDAEMLPSRTGTVDHLHIQRRILRTGQVSHKDLLHKGATLHSLP